MNKPIAYASYPMLWQRQGGLQVQVTESLRAVRAVGWNARLLDYNKDDLRDFSILHVFGAINGNERLVEAASAAGNRVVISPVLNPPFPPWEAMLARLATSLTGRLTRWQFRTSYEQIRRAVTGAHAVVALGDKEAAILKRAYGVESKRVWQVPNGIAGRFFEAEPTVFRCETGLKGPFILQVSSISPYKNPLAAAAAAAALDVPLVLAGGCSRGEEDYLEACRSAAGGRLHYLGALAADSELLASAYAAASALVLPSQGEVMPLVVMESLAAGTPVVMTRNSSLALANAEDCLKTVDPRSQREIVAELRELMQHPPSADRCKNLVRDMSWEAVGEKLDELYRFVLRPDNRRQV